MHSPLVNCVSPFRGGVDYQSMTPITKVLSMNDAIKNYIKNFKIDSFNEYLKIINESNQNSINFIDFIDSQLGTYSLITS